MRQLYDEAVAAGKITPQLIMAAETNLAAEVVPVQPREVTAAKQATQLTQREPPVVKVVKEHPVVTVYQTKVVPPSDAMEAELLATVSVSPSDMKALAASRAKAVQAYLLQTGKVEAARLFLKEDQATGLRSDGSRVYLQFQ